MATKLTDSFIRDLQPPPKGARKTYDTEVKGFGIRITAAGARSFILNYRTRLGVERRLTIGSFPDWRTSAARAEAADLKKEIDRGGDPLGEVHAAREAPTVSDLCDRFIGEYLPRKKATTRKGYLTQIENVIRPALGRLPVADVKFSDIDALHRQISRRAPYQANRVTALVSRLFTMAMRWQWRPDNPAKHIERHAEQKRRRYLTTDELERLTSALGSLQDRQGADIIWLLLLTGARRGEVLSARWNAFDLATGEWSKPGESTKTKIDHHIPLSEAARQLLVDLRARTGATSEWLFPSRAGGHRRDVKKTWAALCKAAQIENARLHDLRHSFAAALASAGLSLVTCPASALIGQNGWIEEGRDSGSS